MTATSAERAEASACLASLRGVAARANLIGTAELITLLIRGVRRGDVQHGPSEFADRELGEALEQAAFALVARLDGPPLRVAPLPAGIESACEICGDTTRWSSRCSKCIALQERIGYVIEAWTGVGGADLLKLVGRFDDPEWPRTEEERLVTTLATSAALHNLIGRGLVCARRGQELRVSLRRAP